MPPSAGGKPQHRRRRLIAGACALAIISVLVIAVASCGGDSADDPYAVQFDGSNSTFESSTGATGETAAKESEPKPKPKAVGVSDLGNLVISGISGLTASTALLGRVERGEVGGVIIMGENVDTLDALKALTRQIQEAAEKGGQLPPLIMVDQEGGEVKRFLSAAPNDSAQKMSSSSSDAIKSIGAQTGNDLLIRGANVDLAPVADVVAGGGNFLGTRAFIGSDNRVSERACAFAAGLRSSGVVSTLKHFPGLGRAGSVNTDDGTVTISAGREQLSSDWGAYKKCANDPGTMVMVASASYPDAYGDHPAVLEPAVYEELRNEIGFEGPVITDALNAVALRSVDDLAVGALKAGADLLLYVDEASATHGYASVVAAFKSGALGKPAVSEKVARVKGLRERLAGLPRDG